jgi:hypothetical protein
MPKLDGTGPEGKGNQSGRKLGRCTSVSSDEALKKLGHGQGLRKQAAPANKMGQLNEKGLGKRLKSGLK